MDEVKGEIVRSRMYMYVVAGGYFTLQYLNLAGDPKELSGVMMLFISFFVLKDVPLIFPEELKNAKEYLREVVKE